MAGSGGGLAHRWMQLQQGRIWRYITSLMGIIHLISLVTSVLCVAFAGHYLGMYRGVHTPGYDLFRPEAFFVIASAGCLMVSSLLFFSVLATEDSQELLFRTVAPELAFGGMSTLWLVGSVVYLAEVVGRNMDYRIRERGFALKVVTAIIALAASCLNAALCVLAWRHRRTLSSLKLKTGSAELGVRSKPVSSAAHRGSVTHSIPTAHLSEHRRLERAPSSPPFVGVDPPHFDFSAVQHPVSSASAANLQTAQSESVRKLTEKTLKHSISLSQSINKQQSSTEASREALPVAPPSPEYSNVYTPSAAAGGGSRHDSGSSSSASGDPPPKRLLITASADHVNQPPSKPSPHLLKPTTTSSEHVHKPRPPGKLPPLPRGPPAGNRHATSGKAASGRPPVPPAAPPAKAKPPALRPGGRAHAREMRRSVSTPNDVDDPHDTAAEKKFASTDHLDGDPANMTFKQRLKLLEQRKADAS